MYRSASRNRLSPLLAAGALIAMSASSMAAAEAEVAPGAPPQVQAVQAQTPPAIDGALDDLCWPQATHVEGFVREKTDAPELERTEAWICCDARAIYVAFRCHDTKPSQIRADQKKRGGSLHHDDKVTFAVDVENAGHNYYQFTANPIGTQADEVPGGTSEKIEWRGDWRAAARSDSDGWTAEMEIPFSILRYPDGQDTFRLHFSRDLAREEDDCAWPTGSAATGDREQDARWVGLALPSVPFRYVFMPYLLSVASENEEDREPLTGGLDFKGTLPNGVATLGTYHPDFRNLEDVVETIDFTFVERYLPEYRPFFQEGSGYLPASEDDWQRGPVGLFYSRRIGELDWGAKTFGTVGPHRFGILDVYRGGGENHLAWKYDHLLGPYASVGFSGVDRRLPGEPDNLAYALGAHCDRPVVSGSRYLNADWYQSQTQGEGGNDSALVVGSGVWREQGVGWSMDYSSVKPHFKAEDGYVPETGVRSLSLSLNHQRSYDNRPLLDMSTYLGLEAGASQDGRRRNLWLQHERSWRNGWGMWAGANRGERDGFDVASAYVGLEWNRRDMYRGGDIGLNWGERYGQPYRYQSLSQAFHPSKRWSAELRAERSFSPELDDDGSVIPSQWSRQLVLTTTYDVSDEKTISARFVRTAAGTNVYAAYRQRVRRGTDLLIVAGDPNADTWVSRLAVKAIWCF